MDADDWTRRDERYAREGRMRRRLDSDPVESRSVIEWRYVEGTRNRPLVVESRWM